MSSALISVEVIENRINVIRARAAEIAKWSGTPKDDVTIRANLVIAEFEDALREGLREWLPLLEAAEKSKYHPQTLREYVRAALSADGELPAHWKGLKARRRGRGYEVLVSSIPPNPRAEQ